ASYSINTHFKETINMLYGQSLFTLNIFDTRNSLLNETMNDNIIISRNFPNKLKIEVIEKKPIVIIKSDNKEYIVDRKGTILPIMLSNLPTMRVDFGIIFNKNQISDEYLIQMLEALEQSYIDSLDSIHISKNRETSFRLKGLSSEFLISKRILTPDFIKKAALIVDAITNKKIQAPKQIDIHNHEKNAVGFF
ncbi:MAG: cell division protein FtsQ/DivIB, partial [Brevinema sp.]